MTKDTKASPTMKATLGALGASLGVAMVTVAYAGDGSVKPPDKDVKNAPADAAAVKLAPADARAVKLAPADANAVKLKPPPEDKVNPAELKQKPAGK